MCAAARTAEPHIPHPTSHTRQVLEATLHMYVVCMYVCCITYSTLYRRRSSPAARTGRDLCTPICVPPSVTHCTVLGSYRLSHSNHAFRPWADRRSIWYRMLYAHMYIVGVLLGLWEMCFWVGEKGGGEGERHGDGRWEMGDARWEMG